MGRDARTPGTLETGRPGEGSDDRDRTLCRQGEQPALVAEQYGPGRGSPPGQRVVRLAIVAVSRLAGGGGAYDQPHQVAYRPVEGGGRQPSTMDCRAHVLVALPRQPGHLEVKPRGQSGRAV